MPNYKDLRILMNIKKETIYSLIALGSGMKPGWHILGKKGSK